MSSYESEAFRIVNGRRLSAERNQILLIEQLRKDSDFAKLENERDRLGFEIARLKALKCDFGSLKEQYDKSKIAFELKLESMGYSLDDLNPHYVCKLCKDTGVVNGATCDCVKQLVYDQLRKGSGGLAKDLPDFSEVDYNVYGKDMVDGYKKLFAFLEKYANSFPPQNKQFMVLRGAVGSGKTYAVSVLANAIMKKGYSVFFLNAPQLNALFLKYHTAKIEDKYDILLPLISADLLVIDDLGTEAVYNNVTINYLYQLLCERDGMPIIFTTNLTADGINERYGQRIFSRLADAIHSIIIDVNGEDIRLNKRS